MTTKFKNQIIAELRSLKNLKVGWAVLQTAQWRGTWVSQTFSLASYKLQHRTLQKSKFNKHCKVDCSCTQLQTCHLMWHQTSWKVTEVSDLQKVMETQRASSHQWMAPYPIAPSWLHYSTTKPRFSSKDKTWNASDIGKGVLCIPLLPPKLVGKKQNHQQSEISAYQPNHHIDCKPD